MGKRGGVALGCCLELYVHQDTVRAGVVLRQASAMLPSPSLEFNTLSDMGLTVSVGHGE